MLLALKVSQGLMRSATVKGSGWARGGSVGASDD